MKFIFIESFNIKDWNGEIARKVKGISGSHSASMYLSEGLANLGHDVYFISINNNLVETTYMGVKYINYCNFSDTICDYIVTTYHLHDFYIFDKLTEFKKIIVLMNNDLCFHEHVFNIDKEHIIIGYLNEFGKINIENIQPFLKDYENIILPNCINLDDIKDVDINNKENSFCFFACVERGLKMAIEVLNKVDNFKLYTNTYADENRHKIESTDKIIKTNGFSKYDIFDCLIKSKYFVYPLINLDNNYIHYDTFAYVVLEAILHGVVVIVPKIAVFEQLYGDALCYVETDGIVCNDNLLYWRKYDSNFGYPLLDKYVEKIKILEGNDELRNDYIQKGLLIGKKYSHKIVSKQLLDYLDSRKNLQSKL
jgi:hypothetical protein